MPKAKHFKAAAFVHSQLFAGLTSFAQLETRIAALPDEKARGHAFEVFAEAYKSASMDGAAMQPGEPTAAAKISLGWTNGIMSV